MPGYVTRFELPLAVDAGGDAQAVAARYAYGRVAQVFLVDGSTPIDAGATLVLDTVETGQVILSLAALGNPSAPWRPRGAAHGVSGAALLFAAAGEPVTVPIVVSLERLRATVASGGTGGESGTLHVWIEGVLQGAQ